MWTFETIFLVLAGSGWVVSDLPVGSAAATDDVNMESPQLGSLKFVMQNRAKDPESTLHV